MLRVHNEGMAAKERGTRGDLRAETDWRSRKFLSEWVTGSNVHYGPEFAHVVHYDRRNFYLTGSTLFLALSLNRVYSLLLDTIKLQDELANVRAQVRTDARLPTYILRPFGLGLRGLAVHRSQLAATLQALRNTSP